LALECCNGGDLD
jgi:serine/threonine protein kinase